MDIYGQNLFFQLFSNLHDKFSGQRRYYLPKSNIYFLFNALLRNLHMDAFHLRFIEYEQQMGKIEVYSINIGFHLQATICYRNFEFLAVSMNKFKM